MADFKYYYVDQNSERQGPFSKEELVNHNLLPTTLVWRKGMPSWVKASEVEELSLLFQQPQQPLEVQESQPLQEEPQTEIEPQQPEPPQSDVPEAVIYCSQCGQQLSANAESCPNCGNPIRQNARPALEVTEAAPAAIPSQPVQQGPYGQQPQQPYGQPGQPYQQPYQQPQQPYPYGYETESKNRIPVGAIIGAIAAALILGGVCLYLFVLRPHLSEKQNTEWFEEVEAAPIDEASDSTILVDDNQEAAEAAVAEATEAAEAAVAEATEAAKEAVAEATEALTTAVEPLYVVVDGVNVRLRTSPAINDYNIIKDRYGKNLHPNKGDRLKYLDDYGDFYKVYYKGHECYIAKQFSYLEYQ